MWLLAAWQQSAECLARLAECFYLNGPMATDPNLCTAKLSANGTMLTLCSPDRAAWGYKFEEKMSMSAPRDMENGAVVDEKDVKM